MSIYKKLTKTGLLSEIPSGWIDNLYLQHPQTVWEYSLQFVKTRVLFLAFFPILSLIDMLSAQIVSIGMKVLSFLTKDSINKQVYNHKASKLYDRSVKNLLGLISFPLGVINPKLVSFYFIPKNKQTNHIVSGGSLYGSDSQIKIPRNNRQLKGIIAKANKNNKKITVVGAGKSQGKQFVPDDANSIVINMKHFNQVKVDKKQKTAIVGAGATWGDLQLHANKQKLAVKVMQASNIFSIGGSISTNIHGWHKTGTLSKTIEWLTIMDPKGNIKKLTPADKLFGYVIGGYSQFGIILEAKLKLADNELLTQKSKKILPSQYVQYYKNNVRKNKDIRMNLYRLSLDPNNLLREGVVVNYCADAKTKTKVTPNLQREAKNGTRFERIMINLARRFNWLRKGYWWYEKRNLINNAPKLTTNEIMQPSINAMFNNARSESEWLQEFFIPGKNLDYFLNKLGTLLMNNQVNLLNASVRFVKQDNISKMGYANAGDRFAVVLCFNQGLTPQEIQKTKKWVREAINLSLKQGGTYYLPYQHFATDEQFKQAYPSAAEVYQQKLIQDPKEIFASGFSNQYMKKAKVPKAANDSVTKAPLLFSRTLRQRAIATQKQDFVKKLAKAPRARRYAS